MNRWFCTLRVEHPTGRRQPSNSPREVHQLVHAYLVPSLPAHLNIEQPHSPLGRPGPWLYSGSLEHILRRAIGGTN